MADEEDFKSEDFTQFTQTAGKKSVEMMGEKKELEYKAKCFINKAHTIGYAEVDLADSIQVAFISKTPSGAVMTITGEQNGVMPLKVEGLHTIMSVQNGTPVPIIFTEHKKALNGEAPIQDETWVKQQTINLPLTAIDVAIAFIKEFMGAFEQVADKMGEALGEVAKGMGQAMEQAFDGISEGMQQATSVEPQVDMLAKPKKPKAKPKPKPKAPAKKAAPSKKKSKPAKKKGKAGKKK